MIQFNTEPYIRNINYYVKSRNAFHDLICCEKAIKRPLPKGTSLDERIAKKAGEVFQFLAKAFRFIGTITYEWLKYRFTRENLKDRTICQIQSDIDLMTQEKEEKLRRRISKFIVDEKLNLPRRNRYEQILCAMSAYAASQKHYGPVAAGWAKSLLDTAKIENRKLVFVGRDGLAPYLVAKRLKKKFPDWYGDLNLSYVYLSRRLVDNASKEKGILRDYLMQNGIQQDDRCIFVDIGFRGSRINSIRDQLNDLNLDIEFQFLVSLTDQARSYISDLEAKLDSIPEASQNLAVYWIEDSHQGVINSPTKLVRLEDGRIQPTTKQSDELKTCKEKDPLNYLIKYWGTKGIEEATDKDSIAQVNESWYYKPPSSSWHTACEKTKRVFDDFLLKVKSGERTLFVDHPLEFIK